MILNYFKIALRQLQKNTIYSFINIAGLSIGIAASILILLWVRDEVSYDGFQPKLNRLYQVWINAQYDGKVNSWTSAPLPTYEELKTANAHITSVTVTDWGGNHLLTAGTTRISKMGHYTTDEFLHMFQFPFVKGSADKVLLDSKSMVITESTAKALFGDKDPMNQMVLIDNEFEMRVDGVVKDVPSNSTFQFDFLLPYKLYETFQWVKRSKTQWDNYSFPVYVELDDAASEPEVENAIRDLLTKKGQTDIKREFFLHPMKRWHLYSNFENGKEAGGTIDYVKLFLGIAIFVLVIACINFMNLATARSERRAREVGLRKSVGSTRANLISQFLGESILVTLIAFVLALVIVESVLPLYNVLVNKRLFIDFGSSQFWTFSVSLVLITGLLAGSYPAFYLSSFKPVKVLKGKVQVGRNASLPRKILVGMQFGFSILLAIGTLVIYKQLEHVKGRHLGYQQENLITIEYNEELGKHYQEIKNELLASGAVTGVTKSNSPITSIFSNNFVSWPGMPEGERFIFATIATDYDYTETMGIKVLEGRDFSRDFPSDSSAIIVNKAAVDLMGLPSTIGEQLTVWDDKRTVIGVIDNVLMGSPYTAAQPMYLVLMPDWVSAITVRLAPTENLAESLHTVETIMNKNNPSYPFEYKFVDAEFGKKFSTINLISRLANLFAVLAIVITCLGLFGLAAYTAEQRTKEIGIRKVLGASISSLVVLMSRDFSRLVLIAFVVTAPLAWWWLSEFLERYPYRITIPWWTLPATGAAALTIALIIVSTQAIRAATANPVDSLRNE